MIYIELLMASRCTPVRIPTHRESRFKYIHSIQKLSQKSSCCFTSQHNETCKYKMGRIMPDVKRITLDESVFLVKAYRLLLIVRSLENDFGIAFAFGEIDSESKQSLSESHSLTTRAHCHAEYLGDLQGHANHSNFD